MTIPACSTHPAPPCPVGCFDDLHVRQAARDLAAAIDAYVMSKHETGPTFRALGDRAGEYVAAVRDPRSERAWPPLWPGDEKHDASPNGWAINASKTEMMVVARALRGPVEIRAIPQPVPPGATMRKFTVAGEPTFRLPAIKLTSKASELARRAVRQVLRMVDEHGRPNGFSLEEIGFALGVTRRQLGRALRAHPEKLEAIGATYASGRVSVDLDEQKG